MSAKDNGGPAFPNVGGHKFTSGNDVRVTLPHPGMSLRDYFAANCGVSFQDAIDVLQSTGVNEPTGTQIIEMIACMRGGIADAMLAERAK